MQNRGSTGKGLGVAEGEIFWKLCRLESILGHLRKWFDAKRGSNGKGLGVAEGEIFWKLCRLESILVHLRKCFYAKRGSYRKESFFRFSGLGARFQSFLRFLDFSKYCTPPLKKTSHRIWPFQPKLKKPSSFISGEARIHGFTRNYAPGLRLSQSSYSVFHHFSPIGIYKIWWLFIFGVIADFS